MVIYIIYVQSMYVTLWNMNHKGLKIVPGRFWLGHHSICLTRNVPSLTLFLLESYSWLGNARRGEAIISFVAGCLVSPQLWPEPARRFFPLSFHVSESCGVCPDCCPSACDLLGQTL